MGSLLDSTEIKETEEFKKFYGNVPTAKSTTEPFNVPSTLSVTSSCPHCGAPIYGQKQIFSDKMPEVIYSCNCRNISMAAMMQTK